MSKTVILTGASGYVGQHILGELLDQNYKVIAIVRSQNHQIHYQNYSNKTPNYNLKLLNNLTNHTH